MPHRPDTRPRRKLLVAAAALLVFAGFGSLSWEEAPQAGSTIPTSLLPADPVVPIAPLRHDQAQLSLPIREITPADEEVTWPEEEKERIRIWAQRAPRAAAARAAILPAGRNRHFMVETAAIAWGERDPSAAAQWARSFSDSAERVLAMTTVAGEAVRSDPILALEIASDLPGAAGEEIVMRATKEWAAQHPWEAADWARGISGESLRAIVLAGIATAWSEQDPVAAGTLAIDALPSGRLQADTVVSIVQRWNQQSPADAAAWVDEFPDGELRDAAIEQLAKATSRTKGDQLR